MSRNTFVKSKIAISLSAILAAHMALPVYAADEAATEEKNSEVEVVEVRGIRGSLMQSMDRKREADGVIDAITSEDIGKFPDTNLAESLQRITGVSIDRGNGEGSRITVRGMGPEFNMVTLNGRQMPTAGGRAFDFGAIATEAVSAVEVYKTGRADLPTGGIGATVNMETARPLKDPGLKAVVSAKAVHETSVEDVGEKFTPEISGLFSNTFAGDKVGVLVSASVQERDNREQSAQVDTWLPNVGTGTGVITDNNQRADGFNWYPQNAGYSITDNSRKRTNAQAVLQFQPNDKVTATLDYTYSKVEFESNWNSFGIWFNNGGSIINGTINERGTYTRVTEAGNDFATNVGRGTSEAENKSLGFNIAFQASDNLKFTVDAHDSSANNLGTGLGNNAFLIIGNTSCPWCATDPDLAPGTASIDIKWADFPAGGIPIYDMTFIDANGNPQAELLPQDIGSLFGGATDNDAWNDMRQYQFSGEWKNSSSGALDKIEFGYARTEQDFRATSRWSGLLPAGWWLGSAAFWPDEQWIRRPISGLLSDFSNAGAINQNYIFTQSFDYILNGYQTITPPAGHWMNCCFVGSWPAEFGGMLGAGDIDSDARVNEVVDSLYTQAVFRDDFNGMPVNVIAGVRYEKAEVTSVGLERPATNIIWAGGNEFEYVYAADQTFSTGKGDTDVFLPSFDFSIEPTEDVVARFSYSRTMTRPSIGAMRSTTDFLGTPKVGQRKIATGNPGLLPYISDNIDLSVEWYYAPGSYASAGYFRKNVDNFLVDSSDKTTIDGIRDVYLGQLAEQARAELLAANIQATDVNVFERMNVILGRPVTTPHAPDSNDPLAVFDVSSVRNGESAKLFGWEFAVQHMFGESGFGASANATIVNGDVEADRDAIQQDFALPGMSDSANFAVFYEDEKFSSRLTYNWRDEFLSGFDQHGSPVYNEEYSQIDATFSYTPMENLTLFIEGLNLTEETQRVYVRYEEQLLRANQYGARYQIGARYTF